MKSIFLQAPETQESAGSGMEVLVFYGLIILIMYMFFFRPQRRRQNEERQFQQEIKKGTRIVTTSGIHGKILDVGDTYLIIESENSRFKIEKSAISKNMSEQYNS
jgi:preprotein translocase subunit YajC